MRGEPGVAAVRPTELARALGVARSAIYRWLDQGAFGPVHRVGRSVLIDRRALERALGPELTASVLEAVARRREERE